MTIISGALALADMPWARSPAPRLVDRYETVNSTGLSYGVLRAMGKGGRAAPGVR